MDSMIGKSFIRLCFLNFFLQAHFVSPSVIVDVPVEATKPRELSTADCIAHLVRFGYLDKKDLPEVWVPEIAVPGGTGLHNEKNLPLKLREAVLEFQKYAGLEETGWFDDKTKLKMQSSRCGNIDKPRGNQDSNVRYQLMNGHPKWPKRDLTYKITQFSETGISSSVIDKDIQRAFNYWHEVTNLNFHKSTDKTVDIEIRFARRYHKDDFPFDGRNGVLAHAFGPTSQFGGIGGDVHFDDDEQWASDDDRGTSLLQTAVHEIGHSLGLSHSNVKQAIMYAFMTNSVSNRNFKLHSDDVAGIQFLYGKKKPEVTTTKPTTNDYYEDYTTKSTTSRTTAATNHGGKPDLCFDPKLDAVMTTANNEEIYAFKGDYVFIINKNGDGVDHARTRRISEVFKGLPSNIDAAVVSPGSGRTYFFKGKYYWRFLGTTPDGNGSPIPISRGFPGIPDDVDAAFVWSGNNKLYFFKGSKYWMYNAGEVPPVDRKYPLEISSWDGIPDEIEAAFMAPNGHTYFFKGGNYWRYDDKSFSVAQAQPPYPRSSRLMWYGCHKYRPHPQDVRLRVDI